MTSIRFTVAALVCLSLGAGAPAIGQTAAPVPAAPVPAAPRANAADVRFMQGMIAHHAQALTMSALVPARTTRDAMHLLAERITVSQRDEIAIMRTWLQAHGQSAPDPMAAHDMAGMAGMHHDMAGMPATADSTMPGMLTAEQLAALGAANGAAFERLFLESMIRHHEGALTMVKQLFASPGAAQDGDVFRFASDVDVDQRAEIARMRTLLAALPR